jgi:hypothetical protein
MRVISLLVGSLICFACGSSTNPCVAAGGRCVIGSGFGCQGELGSQTGCVANPPTPAGGVVVCPVRLGRPLSMVVLAVTEIASPSHVVSLRANSTDS